MSFRALVLNAGRTECDSINGRDAGSSMSAEDRRELKGSGATILRSSSSILTTDPQQRGRHGRAHTLND
jgi:hypothetical protein